MAVTERTGQVRLVDVERAAAQPLSDGIAALYENTVDVLVIRQAVPPDLISPVAAELDAGRRTPAWTRPNAVMPAEDIEVLGLAATPTYSTPRGPSLDAYLDIAGWYDRAPLFDAPFDPRRAIVGALEQLAGGRPVELLRTAGGRTFSPFTVRRLSAGKGIGLHHDLHTSLPMFSGIADELDTSTLVSYVVTLQGADAGGELMVYDLSPATPNPPKLPNGYAWDLAAVEARFASAAVPTQAGDLFVFASSRCLHRVTPVVGPRSRVTMGGFLAFGRDRDRVFFWS
jgi:hypothetical protein